MNDKDKKKIQKYMTLYMSLGMCFGVSGGLVYGMILFPDNMILGMSFGLPIGMCVGIAIGSAKDKRLSENMMEIVRIVAVDESFDMFIYAIDKNGEEKEYRITKEKMDEEKFSVGDRVAEETDGYLLSLESK
ncbi:hypothetical protein SAMN02745248_00462 [Hathewaya proteolytica DSM 3090]|uniref:Uncharacterized protein n=1 Tax=Hathewaya proteolytica DSM 3090 TaxID=1121331 RepID=A0A1M6KGR6_9CLOT|nr:hypothetical protein [Hathewaya proteolytica]SHJ58062.1 hypothetical protein SAMN02745248_00462 [Hathewaya proteolytica DSM 3090]